MKRKISFGITLLLMLSLLLLALTACGDKECEHKDLTYTVTEPTCTERGYTTYVCSKCEYSYIDDYVNAIDHTAADPVTENFVDSTCTVAGSYNLVVYCSECNVKISTEAKTLEKKLHTPVTDPRVEPTFTTTGLTEGSHCSVCNVILVAQDTIPMLPSKTILTSKNLTVEGRNISGSFPYATEAFNFIEDINVTNNSPWVVSIDSYGMQSVATKIAPLAEGNNTFYIHVTNPDQTISTYTVNIYRNHLFTVHFNTKGGTVVPDQYVEEGLFAEEPTTTRVGYTFDSWDYNFENPITSNIIINANWNAHTDTAYNVEHYLENLNRDGYDLIAEETENLVGTTDTTVYAEQKTFTHFTFNASKSIMRGNVNGDGSLVLKVYYTRDSYTVSSSDTSGGNVTNGGSYPYGTEVKVSATATNLGYRFLGWYSGDELISSETTYTAVIDRNIEARFEMLSEMQSFNFTSTATTCTITGIKDKTVTEIIVPDYVTTISSGAFSGCSNLESLTLPFVGGSKSTTSASSSTLFGYIFGKSSYTGGVSTGQYYSLSNSVTYYIPSSLKSVTVTGGNILYGAFSGCSSLTSVAIPDSVTSIGDSAFSGCSSLTSVTIPDSVTSIGGYAFCFCTSLTSINVSEDNTAYKSIDGNLYSKDGKTLIQYAIGKKDTLFTIPNSVTSIGGSAFNGCLSLTSMTIPDSVTSIGYRAFYNCTSLTSVAIPDSVTSIGGYAFSGCYKLVEVINYSSLDITAGWSSNGYDVGYVGNYAIEVHTGTSKIVNVDGYLFYTYNGVNYLIGYVGNDTELVLPDKYNGEAYQIYRRAFSSCDSLTSVTIPDSVTSIGSYAFYGCTSLTSVTIGNGVTSIGSRAFEFCTSLTSMAIPDSVTSIGNYAFSGCTSLTSVTIGNGVTSIGSWAFSSCDSLTSVIFENPNGWWYSSSSTATSGTSISISNLSNTSTAATYLKSTYYNYYWKRT